MPSRDTQWKPGQSGNPGGRRRSLLGTVRRLAADTGAYVTVARMLLHAVHTFRLPTAAELKLMDRERELCAAHDEVSRARLARLREQLVEAERSGACLRIGRIDEWLQLVERIWPELKADSHLDHRDDSEDLRFLTDQELRAIAAGVDGEPPAQPGALSRQG